MSECLANLQCGAWFEAKNRKKKKERKKTERKTERRKTETGCLRGGSLSTQVVAEGVQALKCSKPKGSIQSGQTCNAAGVASLGCRSKLNHEGTAGFSPCFHLPRFHLGYLFLTHSHLLASEMPHRQQTPSPATSTNASDPNFAVQWGGASKYGAYSRPLERSALTLAIGISCLQLSEPTILL